MNKKFNSKRIPKKDYQIVKGTIKEISDLIYIQRSDKNLPDLYKRILVILLPDGQRFFGEIRNNKLKLIPNIESLVNKNVEVEFIFEGSIRDGKKYNNIYINNIKPL